MYELLPRMVQLYLWSSLSFMVYVCVYLCEIYLVNKKLGVSVAVYGELCDVYITLVLSCNLFVKFY